MLIQAKGDAKRNLEQSPSATDYENVADLVRSSEEGETAVANADDKYLEQLSEEGATAVANVDDYENPLYDVIKYPNLSTTSSIAYESYDNDHSHGKITYPEISPESAENASLSDTNLFVTPEVLPSRYVIVEDFSKWMSSMDGGCHPLDICQKAKLVVNKILESISLEQCMEPDKVCKYFTSKQMKKELTASSTDVYIRYFSSFLSYIHLTYRETFPFSVYINIEQRIQR